MPTQNVLLVSFVTRAWSVYTHTYSYGGQGQARSRIFTQLCDPFYNVDVGFRVVSVANQPYGQL